MNPIVVILERNIQKEVMIFLFF